MECGLECVEVHRRPNNQAEAFGPLLRVRLVRPGASSDRGDDALDLGRSDARVDGELEQTRDDVLRDGTSTADLQVPQGLLLVERHRIRWPAADPVLGQVLDDFVPGPRERLLPPDDVLVVRMDHPMAFGGWDEALDPVEALRQRARVRTPLLHPAVQLRELHEADRGRDFRHPIIETDEDVLVLRRLAVMPEEPGPLRDAVVVGDDHAALAGRHVLRRVEREARGVAEVARLLAVVLRAAGLGRVLDDRGAAVPFVTAIACFRPRSLANAFSNASTFGPWASIPDARTSRTALSSSSPRSGRAIGIIDARNRLRSMKVRRSLAAPGTRSARLSLQLRE